MGPSGSGKTTLLNCLSGLDAIDGGEVRSRAFALSAMSDEERTDYRARRMGFVFQFYNLMPVLSAVENVELPLLVARVPAQEARSKALEALDLVGLARPRDARARRAVGRPAPARDDRARARERPGDRLGRRADRRPRQRERRGDRRADAPAERERGLTFLIVTHDIARGSRDRSHRPDGRRSRSSTKNYWRWQVMFARVTLLEVDTVRTSVDERLELFEETSFRHSRSRTATRAATCSRRRKERRSC